MKTRYHYGTAIVLVSAVLATSAQARTVAAQTSATARPAAADPATAVNDPAPATEQSDAVDSEEIVVIGSALRTQEAVQNRRQAFGIVDTLTQDDTGDLADKTLAQALIRVPGVSSVQTLYGEQEAAYVSIRGISPDLSYTSFDGMAMFSSANDGDGLRRVDLNLIPTQISRTTEVFKTFTPDLEAGAIGGITNIIPRSALNDPPLFYIDAGAILQTGKGKYVPGTNSLGHYRDKPLGFDVKGVWGHRFGPDEKFGVVLSGVFRQRDYDYTKRNANGRVFYTATGAIAKADLSDWDNQQPLPSLIRPMDYTHFTRTYGGSAQFEYAPSPDLQFSLLGYYYKQVEDQTFNQFLVENYTNLVRLGPDLARLKIGRVRASDDYDRFENETRSLLFKTVKDFDGDSSLAFRAGYLRNNFYDLDLNATYAYSPANSFITYDTTELSDQITINNNNDLIQPNKFLMNAVSDLIVKAKMTSKEARIDYKRNYDANSEGFGVAIGGDYRDVKAIRDSATITYNTNNAVLGALGFVPNISSYMYNYPVVWIDMATFQSTVKPTLTVNAATTNNAAFSADYGYRERNLAAYASLMYAHEGLKIIGGLRYDDLDFKADSPVAVAGTYNGTFSRKNGGYGYWLPSVLVTNALTDAFRLKGGYSRTLGRPAFGDIARAETRSDQTLTIARGNPNLKPRVSDNFDLAAEYYFGAGGLVSLGGFYKNIKDDIYVTSTIEAINGVQYTVSSPQNVSASKLKGVEFQAVTDRIPGLPGIFRDKLGASFNVTRLWAKSQYVSGTALVPLKALQYQPNWLLNAGVFYRLPGNGEVRVAYNYKSKSPISLGNNALTTYWLEGRGQLDAAIRFSLTSRLIAKLEANDILQEPVRQGYVGPFAQRRYELTRPRSFSFNLVYKM